MNEKQQQLTFEKGITNVPSDAICSDNALEESVGMVYDNGEHRVIQKPIVYVEKDGANYAPGLSAASSIIYVHKTALGDHYIYLVPVSINQVIYYRLKYFTRSDEGKYIEGTYNTESLDTDKDHNGIYDSFKNSNVIVTSNGNTLIIRGDSKIHYSIWQPQKGYYKYYGPIPAPIMAFWLKDRRVGSLGYLMSSTGKSDGIIDDTGSVVDKKAYNDLVKGLYAENKDKIARQKVFCLPFVLRVALKMYDGSYINVSNPILLFPSLKTNSYIKRGTSETTVYTIYRHLEFQNYYSFAKWSDILESIVVFVTRGTEIYDLTNEETNAYLHDADGIYRAPNEDYSAYHETELADASDVWNTGFWERDSNFLPSEMIETPVFYKLCELGLNPGNGDLGEYFNESVLQNIEDQERLPLDYHSLCPLNPQYMYMYNGRLNLASVERGFFEGFDFFLPWDHPDSKMYNYDFYVTINAESGSYVVKHSATSSQMQGAYFFYPDNRATHVVIKATNNTDNTDVYYIDEDLKEHPSLNGAYLFKAWPSSTFPADIKASATIPEYDNTSLEPLPNYVITSEVNNPWVFKSEGYYKVGTGKILAISTVTQALSEGQFGQFPLLVFSDAGIWAMSVGSTGLFTDIHPMSREVCNNPASITQTDGAVFFTSEKGLMVVIGSQVKCVSEQLSNIRSFLKPAFMAYDYRDSLLWLFDGSGNGSSYCYIYSIKSGTFARYNFGDNITVKGAINKYPDYLLQVGNNNGYSLYSLLERPDIYQDGTTFGDVFTPNLYTCTIITRPMKLENALALKSIMQVRHISQMDGSMTLRIFASNNLDNNWAELHSLRGTPWKYYKFRYDFTNLKATDRFAGTMLITQERRTNKLR